MIDRCIRLLSLSSIIPYDVQCAVGFTRAAFYVALPDDFTRQQADLLGALCNISKRNVTYTLNALIAEGFLFRLSHGRYQKLMTK